MVQLKDSKSGGRTGLKTYFNSNMVQLKAKSRPESVCKYFKFQFQYGTIKSYGVSGERVFLDDFNSNMVQLKEFNW